MTYNGKRKESWRNIRRNHDGLFGDNTESARVSFFGMLAKMPTKKDGSFDGDAPDIVDLDEWKKFNALLLDRDRTFSEKDIATLIGYIPAVIRFMARIKQLCKEDGDTRIKDWGEYGEASGFGSILWNTDGGTPAIELGKALIEALQTVEHYDFKAVGIESVLSAMAYFTEKASGRFTQSDFECGLEEGEYEGVKKAFEDRGNLPKGDAYRKAIVTAYLDGEVYDRFFPESESEAYTPARAREWDEKYNLLCDESGEAGYKRNFSDEHYTGFETNEFRDRLTDYSFAMNGNAWDVVEKARRAELAELLDIEPSLLERADILNQSRIEAIRKHGRESLFADKDGDNE